MASAPEETSTAGPHSPNPTKPFRFKHPRSPSPSPSGPPRKRRSLSPPSSTPQNPRHTRRHHHRRHHHHRSKRRPHTPPDAYDNEYLKEEGRYMSPDTAFRESLFDALADDEGAAFWEGVYGQPMHTYSPYYYPASASPNDDTPDDPENPKLERMDDEEYTAYVRSKMWERSHEHILEERRRREEERKRKKAQDEEGRKWQAGVEEALRRGQERRKSNRWKGVWEGYLAGWEERKGKIFWPVESGNMDDVGAGEVEKFFKGVAGVGGVDFGVVLKKERVRWHPDKMQQRAGEVGIDGGTMKVVTAVFQVVDRLWSEIRERA
ncbi:hypothetical protein HO173_007295 [Letharia columbiana]|uniref:Uncharacterized protein n=1 Tax=Letharia columbiana TaxID=112416 RepID=A0A8H6FU16_9LECA|nr:uncharacterized protein HO173_007295 [Letharia columbiana]KAF6234669.1 hypothetical protein HO173_007295 [Letharia columbiana]